MSKDEFNFEEVKKEIQDAADEVMTEEEKQEVRNVQEDPADSDAAGDVPEAEAEDVQNGAEMPVSGNGPDDGSDDGNDDGDDDEDEDDDFIEQILKKNRRQQIAKKLLLTLILLGLTAVVAAGAYLYMAAYSRTHFISGSTINGIDVSGETAKEVKDHIGLGVEDYSLTIHEKDDAKEVLKAGDIGLVYNDDNSVEKLLQTQNENNWLVTYFKGDKHYTIEAGTNFNEKKTREAVKNLDCISSARVIAPKDAELAQDADGKYYIEPEVEGNTVDEGKLTDYVLAAINAGVMDIDIVEEDCYLHPEVRSDNETLISRMNEWNKLLAIDLTYKFGDNSEKIDKTVLLPHISDNGKKVYLSTDWVKPLVYEWGQKYDTFGLPRKFVTHDGYTIDIPAGGDYGWCINKDATIEDIKTALGNGESGEREPIWLFKAMGWDNGDITGTYAEVSISEQKLWCYKDGELVMETDVVTGKPTEARETKIGIYAIDGKKSPATLGTLDVQGYSSPVSYWLPFNGGQGLHDAPWREAFGGGVYLTNGSHGCVNIPEDNMEKIFNSLEIGNAVIVYNDKTPAGTDGAAAADAETPAAENAGENAE